MAPRQRAAGETTYLGAMLAARHAQRRDAALLDRRADRQRAPRKRARSLRRRDRACSSPTAGSSSRPSPPRTPLTHGLLGLPAVSGGLSRIIGVLFGGALLSGAGGVFGALLVIVGVVFAAGLFATQVLLTVVLAVLIVAGPPLIALSRDPRALTPRARMARRAADRRAVPLGWTRPVRDRRRAVPGRDELHRRRGRSARRTSRRRSRA